MDGAILRRVEVTGCDATGIDSLGNSLYVQCATGGKAFFDRLYLHDAACRVSAMRMGSVHPQCVLFNSLITKTAKYSTYGGMGLYVSDASGTCTSYVANCTIADNATRGLYLEAYCGPVRALNNIFADNGAPPAVPAIDSWYICFMHNVIDEAGFAWSSKLVDGYSSGIGDDGTNDPIPTDPKFLDQAGSDYRIPAASPAMDRIPSDGTGNDAFVLTHTNGFVYVDMNKNGSYDQQLDVIVKLRGYAPGTNDWVSTMDLAGRPRLRAQGLDAGCYEWQPPGGTVVTFK
jgi:hypothetical protein